MILLFLVAAGCSDEGPQAPATKAIAPPVAQKITAPTVADLEELAAEESIALRLFQARYPDATLVHGEQDLRWLDQFVKEGGLRRDQTRELRCLGVALGNVFAAKTPLRWVAVEDEYGRELALQYPGTTVIVFPLTMISKRVEDGRDVDVVAIYKAVAAQVEKMKDDQEYKR
jgi:hypothetical protein